MQTLRKRQPTLFYSLLLLGTSLDLASCSDPGESLTGLDVVALRAVVPAEVAANGLIPGQEFTFTVEADVRNTDGTIRTVTHVDYSSIAAEGGVSTTAAVDPAGVTVATSLSNLANWQSGYRITYSVVGNPFPAQVIVLPIYFAGITLIDYSGGDGLELQVYTAILTDEEGQSWRILRFVPDTFEDRWVIIPAGQIVTINADGRNGRNGSSGSRGRRGNENRRCTNGGRGGDGGNGGDGGIITVHHLDTDFLSGLIFSVLGGRGGAGGRGGSGGGGRGSCHSGPDGSPGYPGADGLVRISTASLDEMQAAFGSQDLSGLSW
jgi:hypothetical protein